MNEEIDIIELLKRVKEGNAPKEIEIGGTEYRFCNNSRKIRSLYKTIQEGFIWTNYMTISLDTKIKILDKPKYQIITRVSDDWDYDTVSIYDLCSKVDEIIDYINNKE